MLYELTDQRTSTVKFVTRKMLKILPFVLTMTLVLQISSLFYNISLIFIHYCIREKTDLSLILISERKIMMRLVIEQK